MTRGFNNDSKQEKKEPSEKNVMDFIVCVHNALDDVKNCLDSILRITTLDHTLYIIDDWSDQDTKNYILNFDKEHIHIQY